MKCPYCGDPDLKVINSRPTKEETAVRRRRECQGCMKRITTYEYIEDVPLMVKKQDGNVEQYDRSKLARGIIISVAKRPISHEQVESLVSEIEERCHELKRNELLSADIGEMVMDKLRQLDDIAYIRFASVYRRFKDVGQFREELERLE